MSEPSECGMFVRRDDELCKCGAPWYDHKHNLISACGHFRSASSTIRAALKEEAEKLGHAAGEALGEAFDGR